MLQGTDKREGKQKQRKNTVKSDQSETVRCKDWVCSNPSGWEEGMKCGILSKMEEGVCQHRLDRSAVSDATAQ